MTDADALLAAIRAAPDDDAPRLIYADWLDEHGQPERADFIRVQCQLACRESPLQRKRESVLLAAHHDEFARPLGSNGLRCRFHRGFIVAFSHSGLFVCRLGAELVDEGWTHTALQFSSDSHVLATIGQLHRDMTWQPGGEAPELRGTYELDPLAFRPAFIRFAFHNPAAGPITTGQRPLLEYRGQMLGSTILLERRTFGLGPGVQEIFELVDVPGFDTITET